MKKTFFFALLLIVTFSFGYSGFAQTDEAIPNPVTEKNRHYFDELRKVPHADYFSSKVFRNNNIQTDAVNVYVVSRTTGITYTPLTGASTISSWRNGTNIDDNMSNNLPIGFTYVYNGIRTDSFRVSTSGFITFNTTSSAVGGGTGAYGYDNTQFSSSTGSLNTLAAIYDDLQVVALTSSIVYKTEGSAGNRILTVEFIGMDYTGNTSPDLNFQVKIYEADGHIEFIYGTMTAGSASYTYSCGINAAVMSTTPTAAQLLTQQTVNTSTFSNTAQNSLATVPESNSRISFTTPLQSAPASPTGLNFTSIGTVSMTINWTDNSNNETGFPVYISNDGSNYVYIGSAAANAVSIGITGLTPGTTYYYQVWASNETMYSTAAATGSQATSSASPLSGGYTIDPGSPISATNYQTFSQADTALINNGVSGPVVFTVTGTTYNERSLLGPIPGSSATNTVKFVGPVSADARAVINATGTSATNDYAIALVGSDYVTYENIDVTCAGTSTANQIEYGYYIVTNTTTDGATNNTIKGANIVLGGSNFAPGFSHGILQSTLTGATQANNNNTYENVRVDRSDRGVGIFGLTAPALPTEDNIIIRNCILGQNRALGDTLTGTSGSPIGIIVSNCNNFLVYNNTLFSVKSAHASSTASPLGISGQNSSGSIYNNIIKEVYSANTTSTTVRPVGIQASGLLPNIQYVYNNFVANIYKNYTAAASATIAAVGLRTTQQGGAGVVRWYNNSVYMSTAAPVTYTTAVFASFAGGVNFEAKNNIFINTISTTSVTAKSYGINEANVANTFYTGNYNNIYTPGTNGYFGLKGTGTFCLAKSDWNTASGQDLNSVSSAVTFVNSATGDLHLAGGSIGDNANLGAPPQSPVTTDIDGNTRGANKMYKGADEGSTGLTRSDLTLTINMEAINTTGMDTITVELRDGTAPFNVRETYKGMGGASTSQVFNFYNAANGTSYYFAVKHRNSIETWSNTESFTAGANNLDFTSAQSKAYGNNMVNVGGEWSFYQGDINKDGVIDGADGSMLDNDAFNFVSGPYVITDLNWDTVVDGFDATFVDNNASNFISKITP